MVWFGTQGEMEGGGRCVHVCGEGGRGVKLSVKVIWVLQLCMKLNHVSLITWRMIFKIHTCVLCKIVSKLSQGWWTALAWMKILSHWETAGGGPDLVFRAMWWNILLKGQSQGNGTFPGLLDATLKHHAGGFAHFWLIIYKSHVTYHEFYIFYLLAAADRDL